MKQLLKHLVVSHKLKFFPENQANKFHILLHARASAYKSGINFFSTPSSREEIVTIDVHAAKDLIKSGYGYIDVSLVIWDRTPDEYKKGHVEAGKIFNIPYMLNTPEGRVKNPQFLTDVLSACNKEDRLVVGCQSGVRSLSATSDLYNAGFKHVSNMGGGYLAWVENGFSIEKPKEDL